MSEENLYQRGGIWWLRATVQGKEFRESLRTHDVKAARRLRDKKLAALRAEAFHGERLIPWHEAAAEWGAHSLGQVAPRTAQRYLVSLAQCEPWLKPKNIHEIDGKTINELIAGRRRAGATPATIRRDLTAISQVLKYAEAQEWREGNPTLSKRTTLKERRDPIQLPEPAEIEEIIEGASIRFGAMIRAAWLTGCRQDELVNVEWRGFNARAKTLEVIGKGNKRRVIQLTDAASAHISAQPRTLKSPLIFCHESGEVYAQAASDYCHVRREVEGRAKKEGREFRRFRFHDLRHLFAVETLRSASMDIYTLSQHLGHTSVKTTEIYLAFLTPEQARAAKHGLAQNTAQPRRSYGAE